MNKILGVIFVLALVVFSGVTLIGKREVTTLGNVGVSDANLSTTTDSGWANSPRLIASASDIQMISTIVIGTTHASIVEIKDATSTTDIASTTIAILGASPANGSTLTLNSRVLRGLIVNTPTGFAGRYTITYK